MGYRGAGGGPSIQMQIPLTKVVKILIIANFSVWLLLQVILEGYILPSLNLAPNFGLVPFLFLFKLHIWQPFTYMFLHSNDVTHIIFNMLLLWMIGSELEQKWGARFFAAYYFVCGVGAAILYSIGVSIYGMLVGSMSLESTPVIGASGAIFGLLLAYGIVFGERIVHFMFIFPMKAKYFVLLLGGIEFLMILTKSQSGVSNLSHICGIIAGYLFLLFWTKKQQRSRQNPQNKNRPKLRLVVDQDSPSSDTGSKYWN